MTLVISNTLDMFTGPSGKKMRFLLLIILLASPMSLFAQFRNSQYDQTRIPLSNSTGVPYLPDRLGPLVGGFEVDSVGDYYFMGGPSIIEATLVKMDKNGKSIFRHTYPGLCPNQIHLDKGRIYFFDNYRQKNTMYVLNANTGSIIGRYPFHLRNTVNDIFWFTDSTVTLWVWDYGKPISVHTPMGHVKFSIKGKYLGQVKNEYDLPAKLYQDPENNTSWYLGSSEDTLIFVQPELTNNLKMKYKFWLEDTSGQVLDTAIIGGAVLGSQFDEAPEEHWKLRNHMIYVLMQEGKDALITRINPEKLFDLSAKSTQ